MGNAKNPARKRPGEKVYFCVDLKSFYASVECVDHGWNPFEKNLVVADPDRTEKTICLAVSPALKALGVPGRCRVFQLPKNIDYYMAKPRMKRYMEVSSQIYSIYLRWVSPQDVHVYSIDECFIDATPYLALYDMDARTFAQTLIDAIFKETGICATAGVGTNLFLAKVALDITAKHDSNNIGFLNETLFKQEIWFHHPITDIWNIGPGIARRLAKYGVYDLAGVCAMKEATLYKEFGVNAEYLIDHAWGQEACTIEEIHSYVPEGHSLVNGQVLPCDYTREETRMVMHEMVDASILELIQKKLVAESISLSIGYAKSNQNESFCVPDAPENEPPKDELSPITRGRFYSRTGGTRKLGRRTNSAAVLKHAFDELFNGTTSEILPIRRISIGFGGLLPEKFATVTLFDDVEAEKKERTRQEAIIAVREKFGKNALLKGTSLQKKATARERNKQIGGHCA